MSDYSITKGLQDETLVSDQAIQEFQDDWRQAEKERLQSTQKRGQLLDSLRQSMKEASSPTSGREEIQEEFTRIIHDGTAQEVERILHQYQKQLERLKAASSVSTKTETSIRHFLDRTHAFLEKKKMLEKIENTIHNMSVSALSDATPSHNEFTQAKLHTVSSSLRSDLLSLADTIGNQIEHVETEIAKDLQKEEKQKTLFYGCLSTVNEQMKRKLISLYQNQSQNTTFDKRIHFFNNIIEQLAKADKHVAQRIHSIIRKNARKSVRQKRHEDAVSELCYALSLWKDDLSTYRLLAEVFFRQKKEKNAYIALEEVLRLSPEDNRLRKRLAAYWARTKKNKKAIQAYQILLGADPSDLSYRRELGRLLYEEKSYRWVVDVLLEYLRAIPDDRDGLNYMGYSYFYLKEWEECIYYFEKSIEQNPNQIDIFQALSVAYRHVDHYAHAVKVLKAGVQANPDSSALKMLLGSTYLECEMWDQGLEILKPLLAFHPESATLHVSLGQAYFALGQYDNAVHYLEEARQHNPNDITVQRQLAQAYKKQGNDEDVESLYDALLEAKSIDSSLLEEMVCFYTEKGQWQKATEIMKKQKTKTLPKESSLHKE